LGMKKSDEMRWYAERLKILHKQEEASRLELLAEALERKCSEPARITWDPG
jgi:hypothetical protein